MPKQINKIGRDSSKRLADTITSGLADAILREKALNGDFCSWEDLRLRVHGLGEKKIQVLKNAGFEVTPPPPPPPLTEEIDTNVFQENYTVRQNVADRADATWRYRNNHDIYTDFTKAKTLKEDSEVDHVIECQQTNASIASVSEGKRILRSMTAAVENLFNSEKNLNVTTMKINRAKWGPIKRFMSAPTSSGKLVEEFARESCPSLVQDGTWNKIEQAQVLCYDEMLEEAADLSNSAASKHIEELLEHLKGEFGKMGIM